ncbi:MAG: DUF5011 domain-containing protein [Bacilli bacterium]|nr:DUF5011 domain-containing protein [Bacilli bacterium]
MKYNKKVLIAVAVAVVVILIILLIVTRNAAEKKKIEEYDKLIASLCSTAVNLEKTNSNTIALAKEVGEYTFVPLRTLSLLTIESDNRIPINLKNPKLSSDKKPVYFEDTKALKLYVDDDKKVVCKELVDLGEGPKITLKGEKAMVLKVGDKYVEPGYTATDKEDGDLTSKVLKNGLPDTTTRGEYTVLYFLEDSMRNKTSEVRTISVK